MANREWRIQLKDRASGESIIAAGGKVTVCQDGSPDKQTLYDKDGAALANPVTPTRGMISFYCADTVEQVDLFIQAPGGQFVDRYDVKPSGPNEIEVDTAKREQLYKIPFSHADDAGDATETDTGYDLPASCFVLDRLNGCGLLVVDIDATETIDVGTLTGETGADPNGLIAAHSVGTAGAVVGTNGALFSSNAPYASDANASKSISYTLTAGTDTAAGFILLPVVLAA